MRRFEFLIEWGLFACALLSVGTTIGIIAVLTIETFAFLREVPVADFLFGTEWTPLFATPRALALSYLEGYIDFTGRIKAYAVVDLRVMDRYDWRLSTRNIWKVEQMLLDWRHRTIVSSDQRAETLRRRYRAFREAHGYKPWKYYRGRERWTALPQEFARRG